MRATFPSQLVGLELLYVTVPLSQAYISSVDQ